MATVKIKATAEMKLKGVVHSHSRTDVTSRDVTASIDEPVARGGTNMGLTPTETLISALIACTNVISQKIAHDAGVHFGAMEINATVEFDRRGAMLVEEVDVPFPNITLDINVATDATPEQMNHIKTELGKFCPIAKVLRQAGSKITENWNTRPL